MNRPLTKILVLGGGSAGFVSALNLKQRNPDIDVLLVRSPTIGTIGVGESTIHTVPKYLHGYLGIDPAEFFRQVEPTWKLGVRFLWGSRDRFHYTFRPQVDLRYEFLPMPMGFYYGDEFEYGELASSLCAHDRVFARRPDGSPHVSRDWAYHLENDKLVTFLETCATRAGVRVVSDTVTGVEQDTAGVVALNLESGSRVEAELFVDCSGFRSELLRGTLGEPWIDFRSSLYCDRAVIGRWRRPDDDPIRPYTTAETMNAGWCWRIDHEHWISRGYVYSSDFVGDDQAEAEYRVRNPRVERTAVVRFPAGRYRSAWVKNVVAIGNAGGFVEPLESTALHVLCQDAKGLAESVRDCRGVPGDTVRRAFNQRSERTWEAIRGFLAVHYKFNTRSDTPFWRACREDADIGGAEPIVEYYRRNGPSTLWHETLIDPLDLFGLDGYYTILMGLGVGFERRYEPSDEERRLAEQVKQAHRRFAEGALTSEEALTAVRAADWRWSADVFR